MDWFKVDADIATKEKVDNLSDGAYRAMTYIWGYAMRHETGGHVPRNAARLIPRVSPARLRELEKRGFLHRNGDGGWVIHDWDEHQAEALKIQERRRKDAERKRAARTGQGRSADDD